MGNVFCNPTITEEHIREIENEFLKHFVKRLAEGPDLRVNKSIEIFTGLTSSDNLRQHYETRKKKTGKCSADWIKNLAEKLDDLTPAPELAGLGALAVAILIDIVSSSPPEESTKDALQRVFTDEEASEVWDQVDNSLQRCMMHIQSRDKLRSDMEWIERQLSAALTELTNSMLRDGHMTSPALKAWVNGAAFHVQMLIHLVRLGGIQTCDPVEELLWAYQSDLDMLFKRHREMIQAKCSLREKPYFMAPNNRYLVDEDSKWYILDYYTSYDKYLEAYYEHRYGRQVCEIQQYFSDVSQNLQQLVNQRGSFNVS